MEIPIEDATADLTTAKVVLEAQDLEIKELQAVIVRMRDGLRWSDRQDYYTVLHHFRADWQGVLDELNRVPMRLSGDAVMLVESLAGPGIDAVRDAIADLEANLVYQVEDGAGYPPDSDWDLLTVINKLKAFKQELEDQERRSE